MRRVVALYRSSVGKKVLMAVTGFVWFGFLVGHLVGNLKLYMGADHFDEYAHHLREIGEPILPPSGFLWAFRAVVFAAFLIHVIMAWETSRTSWDARSTKYRKQENLSFSFSSRFMRWGGVFILVFMVFHLLHLTTGQAHPDFVAGEAYANTIVGLSNPFVAGFYMLAIVAVCTHLYHGLWSMFQTLGAAHPKYHRFRRPFAVVTAALLFVGFVSIPVAVLTGFLAN
jgi:succinate dehydrogenase / fumarate reductase cytochrome b subunit